MYSFVRHIKDKLLQVVRTKKICGYSSRKKIYHIAYITSNVLMNLINDMYETSSSKKRLLVVLLEKSKHGKILYHNYGLFILFIDTNYI
jgi:hypothetical protein